MTVARELDLVDRPRATRLRSWFLPRKRDTLLIPAIALGICWAAVDAIPLDRSTEMVFILGVEADEVTGLLAGGLVAALLVWALARCWLKPSRRVLPSLIRVGISVPLIWMLALSAVFLVVQLAFAFNSTHIRVDLEGREEQLLLVVEPGLGDGDATLLRGGPFRYEIIGGPTFIKCWHELNDETVRVTPGNPNLTLTADLSEPCAQSVPFRIPFALD